MRYAEAIISDYNALEALAQPEEIICSAVGSADRGT